MKLRDFQSLCREDVLPHVDRWVLQKEWIVRPEAQLVVCGIMFAPSRYIDREFVVHATASPLYAPRSHVGDVISRELRPPKESRLVVWEVRMDKKPSRQRAAQALINAIAKDAGPWFATVDEPHKILRYMRSQIKSYKTEPAYSEASALSALASGDSDTALAIMSEFEHRWEGDDDPSVEEKRKLFAEWRATIANGKKAVRERLLKVSEEGLRELGLEKVVKLVLPKQWL